MKIKFILTLLVFCSFNTGFGQQVPAWEKWRSLIGSWAGEGSGQPGQGGGTFSFANDLDNKILIRKSHSEYPSPPGKVLVHEDIMIIYSDSGNLPTRAIYFDNEGHTINYRIRYPEKEIILTSEASENNPVFRLVYSFPDSETCNTRFEISQDGVNFTTYIEGKSKRIK